MTRPRAQSVVPPASSDAAVTKEPAAQRTARSARARRARRSVPSADSWIESRDGRVAHERAAEDLGAGRVQHLDHAEFLDAFDITLQPARAEWTVTDEFGRRYERLRGRSHRAVAAALEAFVAELARAAPHAAPKGRHGLELRRLPPDYPVPGAWALSWSSSGRATYLVDWRPGDLGPVPHVTWLAIGPHGAPDRRRWRGNA